MSFDAPSIRKAAFTCCCQNARLPLRVPEQVGTDPYTPPTPGGRMTPNP